MANYVVISKERLNELFDEEERSGKEYLNWKAYTEIDGLHHEVYEDRRYGTLYAIRKPRTVHMGFNSNEEGKVDEFIAVMEKEGICNASWGVTGRTMHQILANQLATQLPQYRFVIGYNYECCAYKDEIPA